MFDWSEDDRTVRAAVRDWVDNEVRPIRDDLEHGGVPPYAIAKKYWDTFGIGEQYAERFDWDIRRLQAEAAGESFAEPEPDDFDPALGSVANIELVKVCPGIPTAIGISTGMTAGTINAMGTVEQRLRWARDLITLDKVGAWAITEPDAGSDAFGGMRTTARPDGDGWVINGQKTFITNGQHAGLVCVVAKTDPKEGAKGVSLIMVEVDEAEGYRRGRNLEKIGHHAQDTSELFFDDVRVPTANLLGDREGLGFIQLMQQLPQERLVIAIQAVAAMERAVEITVAYTKDRKAFGKRLLDFQNTRFKLAECKTEATVARSFVEHCTALLLEKKLDVQTAAMAKWWTTQKQCEIVDACNCLAATATWPSTRSRASGPTRACCASTAARRRS